VTKAAFSAAEIKRFVKIAKEAGFPVDRMGLFVDGTRLALLPPTLSSASLLQDGQNPLDRVLNGR
jgi:hypothetical protein